MSDGAEPHAAVTWIGDERAKLEGQRARLERQIEALAEAKAALMRYAELAGQDVDCRRTQAAGTGEDGAGATAPPGAVTPPPAAPGEQGCARGGAAFEPRQRGGIVQRYCGVRCRRLAHQERRKPKAAPDDPEPLEVLLQAPMPVVEEAAAPPAAPVRIGPERDYAGSLIANAPPIHEDRDDARARMHDRAGDDRFVAALAPALSPEARQRALAVRVQAVDPAAQLLG